MKNFSFLIMAVITMSACGEKGEDDFKVPNDHSVLSKGIQTSIDSPSIKKRQFRNRFYE